MWDTLIYIAFVLFSIIIIIHLIHSQSISNVITSIKRMFMTNAHGIIRSSSGMIKKHDSYISLTNDDDDVSTMITIIEDSPASMAQDLRQRSFHPNFDEKDFGSPRNNAAVDKKG